MGAGEPGDIGGEKLTSVELTLEHWNIETQLGVTL